MVRKLAVGALGVLLAAGATGVLIGDGVSVFTSARDIPRSGSFSDHLPVFLRQNI